MLKTRRLDLRDMRNDDAQELYRVFSDPEVMRYFGDTHDTPEATRRWVHSSVAAPRDETLEYVLVLDGRVIGKAGIWHRPEIGFLLARERWGEGLMREALETLIPHFLETMALDRITADVDPRNAASLSLLRRLGFRETHRAQRTIRIRGEWCDSVYLERRA